MMVAQRRKQWLHEWKHLEACAAAAAKAYADVAAAADRAEAEAEAGRVEQGGGGGGGGGGGYGGGGGSFMNSIQGHPVIGGKVCLSEEGQELRLLHQTSPRRAGGRAAEQNLSVWVVPEPPKGIYRPDESKSPIINKTV